MLAILIVVTSIAVIAIAAVSLLPSSSDEDIIPSDYSDADNWMKLPESTEYAADVIYLYPTAFNPSYEGEMCSIDNVAMRERAKMCYEEQATAFEGLANMYAPYYRQIDASLLAGMTQPEMIEMESGEPKADVFAALDYYFEYLNDGRPYILAGHSQGSMMIGIVMSEYMEAHDDVYDNMIAAYMIGNAATRDWLAENQHVVMAEGATDTGVLVTWNAEGPGNKDHYNMVVPEGSVCINPLNWKTDDTYAGIEENLGCFSENDDGVKAIVKGFADAEIDLERGSVIVRSVDPDRYAVSEGMEPLFGPESYHGNDYAFFYMNIHYNAEDRIEAFLSR